MHDVVDRGLSNAVYRRQITLTSAEKDRLTNAPDIFCRVFRAARFLTFNVWLPPFLVLVVHVVTCNTHG